MQARESSFPSLSTANAIFFHAFVNNAVRARSLPHVIKGRGRSAWEVLAAPLKAALNRLDADTQVCV